MIKGSRATDGVVREPRVPRESRPKIDPVSKAIIEQLQQDGRRPYAAIADSLGVTEATVQQRVEQLTANGMMQIVAVTDPLQLGFARQAMLGVTVVGAVRPVAKALAAIDDIDYVVITTGGFDILAEVVGETDAHLLEVVTTRVKPIPGVISVHTFLYTELQKQSYAWGVR